MGQRVNCLEQSFLCVFSPHGPQSRVPSVHRPRFTLGLPPTKSGCGPLAVSPFSSPRVPPRGMPIHAKTELAGWGWQEGQKIGVARQRTLPADLDPGPAAGTGSSAAGVHRRRRVIGKTPPEATTGEVQTEGGGRVFVEVEERGVVELSDRLPRAPPLRPQGLAPGRRSRSPPPHADRAAAHQVASTDPPTAPGASPPPGPCPPPAGPGPARAATPRVGGSPPPWVPGSRPRPSSLSRAPAVPARPAFAIAHRAGTPTSCLPCRGGCAPPTHLRSGSRGASRPRRWLRSGVLPARCATSAQPPTPGSGGEGRRPPARWCRPRARRVRLSGRGGG